MRYLCVNFPVIDDDNILLMPVVRTPRDSVRLTYTQVDRGGSDYRQERMSVRSDHVIEAIKNDIFSNRDVTM